ncbi:MAG: hypothetical protein H7239_11335 [Flavobacterium sp.]|nr:hypothetical protein [Flavobacterium sp.]
MKINFKNFVIDKKLLYFFSIIIFIVLSGTLYFQFIKNNSILNIKFNNPVENLSSTESDLKNDSLCKLGFCANENIVVTEDAPVRRTANYAKFNTVYNLKFGTVIYTKNIDEKNNEIKKDRSLLNKERRLNYIAVYALKPIFLSDKPVGYMLEDDFIEKSTFKNYVPKPKEVDPITLETSIKSLIDENLNIDGELFNYAKDGDRFNKSIIYGDFNGDENKDFAIVLDNLELINSGILVFLKNDDTNKYDLVFKKSYSSILTIKLLAKETKIIVNNEKKSFPIDGFQITNTNLNSFSYIFNNETKSFTVFQN